VALDLFLHLADSAARRDRLPVAAGAASAAGEHRLALQFCAQARQQGGANAALVAAHLHSLAALGHWSSFVQQARADEQDGHASAVLPALLAEERELLPAAERLLRAGEAAAGLWIFAALARAAPDDGVRAANLALAQRQVGNLPEAEAAYRRALALAPADEQIWSDYGLFLRATGQPAAALDAFAHSLAVEPEPGRGPAITNLVLWEALTPGTVAPDPLPLAARTLALRPDTALLRRGTLDLILARHAVRPVRTDPDKRPPGQ
jgi:tetratricopeptide (TPR) repeat protein